MRCEYMGTNNTQASHRSGKDPLPPCSRQERQVCSSIRRHEMMQELSLAQGMMSPSFNPVTVYPLHNFSDIHSTSYYALTSFDSQRKTGLFWYLALRMDKSMVFGHSKKWFIAQLTLFARHILEFNQSLFASIQYTIYALKCRRVIFIFPSLV